MAACIGAPTHAADTFSLSATAADFGNYFPSYLANGYFSTLTGLRGTEGNLAYMVGFMDYADDDMSRPAAIPGWSEIDYSTGDSAAGHFWMNQVAVNPAQFADYSQALNMQEATLTTHYRYVDHNRSTRIKVTTFVSQASTHLAATQLAITPDFDGTVELSFALNLWAPHQPRLPLARLTGEEMQEAVAKKLAEEAKARQDKEDSEKQAVAAKEKEVSDAQEAAAKEAEAKEIAAKEAEAKAAVTDVSPPASADQPSETAGTASGEAKKTGTKKSSKRKNKQTTDKSSEIATDSTSEAKDSDA